VKEYYAEQAKDRQRAAGGDVRSKANLTTVPEPVPEAIGRGSRDEAGEKFGVSGRSITKM